MFEFSDLLALGVEQLVQLFQPLFSFEVLLLSLPEVGLETVDAVFMVALDVSELEQLFFFIFELSQ